MYPRFVITVASSLLILGAAMPPVYGAGDTVTVEVSHIGRNIMLDGFLMEWSGRTVRPWGSDTAWLWDAAVTPDGLAGYLRTRSAPQCSTGEIVFSGSMLDRPCVVRLPMDSAWRSDFLILDRTAYDSSGVYSIEWLFPWPKSGTARPNPFALTLQRHCLSNDSLPVLVLKGLYGEKKANTTGPLIGRIVLIGLLATMYFMIQRKIRRQSPQTEFPHRSA